MGVYRSKPITDKESSDEIGGRVICGASSMQGWRKTQEDAHNCTLDYDTSTSLFAVYDGHGGAEVAVYSAQHLPEYLKNCEAYKKGDYTQALKDAFLGFDATLIKSEVSAILKQLAESEKVKRLAKNKSDDNNSGSGEDEEEENVKNLYEEAEMPLEQVIAKYQNDLLNSTDKVKDEDDKATISQFLRARRSCSSGASSSRAGTSSSDCGTSQTAEPGNGSRDSEEFKEEAVEESSERQAESGASNGNSKPDETVEKDENKTDCSGDAKVGNVEKSGDDKSEDKKAKKDKLGNKNTDVGGVNGEIGDEEKTGVNGDVTEGGGDKGKETARISPCLRRRCATALYRTLLESQDNSDSDSDDEEGDESFQGEENSSEDGDDEDEDEDEENEDEDGKDDNEDGEDGMLDDEEDEDDDDGPGWYSGCEPGIDSGCTAVVALLKGQELYVANAGDSRCVVCRKGQAIEMSLDHKPEDDIETARIVKAGGRVSTDGRVNGGLNLSRALGDHQYKQSKDLPAEEQQITALPDIRTLMIDPKEDEFMVLACDGIWNLMSSQEVVSFVREHIQKGETKLSKICEEMFDHCLSPNTYGDGSGCDNMTAVIVQFLPELAKSSDKKSIKRATSPTKSDSAKNPRTEDTADM